MSTYRKLVLSFWPRNTMRVAYLRWEAQESRLVEARRQLDHQYLALHQQARQVQIEAQEGILRAARSMLDQPLDPMVLRGKGRLARVFGLLGTSLFRRVPSPVGLELSHYIARIETICRRQGELGARLRLAQAIMTILGRTPDFCTQHFFRLALIAPESAWLLLHIRQKRLQDRQARQYLLSKDCQLHG